MIFLSLPIFLAGRNPAFTSPKQSFQSFNFYLPGAADFCFLVFLIIVPSFPGLSYANASASLNRNRNAEVLTPTPEPGLRFYRGEGQGLASFLVLLSAPSLFSFLAYLH